MARPRKKKGKGKPQKPTNGSRPGEEDDPNDPGGTSRPNLPPSKKRGKEWHMHKMDVREPVTKDLPDTALGIFQAFLPDFIVQEWADATNAHVASLIESEAPTPRRLQAWQPLTVPEVYVFVAMVICMQNATEKSITDYWRSYKSGGLDAVYPWTEHMPLNRFQAIWRYIRLCDYSDFEEQSAAQKAYGRVDKWSQHLQETTTSFYTPGSIIAVDECMQRYTGKSALKTIVKNKPTPEGIKVWAVAQAGILLRWLWHMPGSGVVLPNGVTAVIPDELNPETEEPDPDTHITPTQSVVIHLLNLLPESTYHVYLDNLFSSPALFTRLRDMGHCASGTCRVGCGIHEDLVHQKKNPASTAYHEIREIATEDGRVSNRYIPT